MQERMRVGVLHFRRFGYFSNRILDHLQCIIIIQCCYTCYEKRLIISIFEESVAGAVPALFHVIIFDKGPADFLGNASSLHGR